MNRTDIPFKKLTIAGCVSLALTACAPEFDNSVKDINYSPGTADFSSYVAVGDSLTAGYADGALYLDGQTHSFPALLAGSLAKAGGGAFSQPLVADNNGGLLLGGNKIADTRLVLGLVGGKQTPKRLDADPATDIASPVDPMPNNMGVPGAKSFHLGAPGYGALAGVQAGTANPYFVRFASSDTATVIGDAAAQQPSFFTLWVGNNDVLSYATSGGDGEDQTGNPDSAKYGPDDITDPNVFAATYQQLLGALKAAGGKGVLINIPNVTDIPYFTTVPWNPVPLDQANADALNAAYAAYNGGIQQALANNLIDADEAAARTISFAPGQNPVVIEDEDLTDLSALSLPSIRQTTADDLLVLTASSKIGTLADDDDPNSAWGVGTPLEDGDVLVRSERDAIANATAAYNATIKDLADADDDLALVDINGLMNQVANGYSFGTGQVTATFGSGGAFSLDGIHPTQRGYALITNVVIDAIESQFGAKLPRVEPMEYPTIFLDPNGPS